MLGFVILFLKSTVKSTVNFQSVAHVGFVTRRDGLCHGPPVWVQADKAGSNRFGAWQQEVKHCALQLVPV